MDRLVITPDTPGAGAGPEGDAYATWLTDHGVVPEQCYCIEFVEEGRAMIAYCYKRGPQGEARVLWGGSLALEEPRLVPIHSECPIQARQLLGAHSDLGDNDR